MLISKPWTRLSSLTLDRCCWGGRTRLRASVSTLSFTSIQKRLVEIFSIEWPLTFDLRTAYDMKHWHFYFSSGALLGGRSTKGLITAAIVDIMVNMKACSYSQNLVETELRQFYWTPWCYTVYGCKNTCNNFFKNILFLQKNLCFS